MSEQKNTEEMIEIVESLVNLTSLRKTAKRIGISPEALHRALKNKTVSNNVANFFGYEKRIVYVQKHK